MQNEEIDSSHESADTAVKYINTLPDFFNDTVGKSLKMENTKLQNMIETIGKFLGITDYDKNLASFWFLDVLALQLQRSNHLLDDHTRLILISWLVGEMEMIRNKKFSREKFLDEMEHFFTAMAKRVSRGKEIPHWNLIVLDSSGMESEMEEPEHELSTMGDLEAKMRTPRGEKPKGDDDEIKFTQPEMSDSEDSKTFLDIIIRSTYDMYAGEVRYALIYAVFAESIEIQVYNLPFTYRKPRPTRLADSTDIGNFNLRLRKALQKVEQSGTKLTKPKSSTGRGKAAKQDETKEYPAEPPNSLLEENLLSIKRSFILPLIESEEAVATFDYYQEPKI